MDLKVIPDFFSDPDAIRNLALGAWYESFPIGNYIGRDTRNQMIMKDELEEKLSNIFEFNIEVTSSKFRFALEHDSPLAWVHTDPGVGWHLIVPLMKSDVEDGVVFWEHVKHGRHSNVDVPSCETLNLDLWTKWHTEPYKYNRAVIFDFRYFHSPMHQSGYGANIAESRLYHICKFKKGGQP
jgi:hypothetical protein